MSGGDYASLTPTVPGAVPSSWALDVRNSVILRFATAAARDSALTGLGAGDEGMVCYLKDSDRFCVYTGAAWAWLPGTPIARGNRTTNSSTSTGVEVGVLRLPCGALVAGQAYRFRTSPLHLTGAANDIVCARLRYTTDATNPTTSSTIMPGSAGQGHIGNTSYTDTREINAVYVPGVAVADFRVLLTVVRIAGTGSAGIIGDATNIIELTLTAEGTDPGDTGVDI